MTDLLKRLKEAQAEHDKANRDYYSAIKMGANLGTLYELCTAREKANNKYRAILREIEEKEKP